MHILKERGKGPLAGKFNSIMTFAKKFQAGGRDLHNADEKRMLLVLIGNQIKTFLFYFFFTFISCIQNVLRSEREHGRKIRGPQDGKVFFFKKYTLSW